MKLHNNLIEAVAASLTSIFFEGYYADKVIQRIIKSNPRWGSRDRRIIAEMTYGIVRNWRMLNEINGSYPNEDAKQLNQIMAIHLYLRKEYDLPFVQEHLPDIAIEQIYKELLNNPAVRESFPDWLYERGKQELGESWDTEMAALNKTADVIIRTNTLKTNRDELITLLKKDGIEVSPIESSDVALQLTNRQNLFTSEAFKAGMFEIQDTASQGVAEFTRVQPGMRVIDACAGGGGKSLHLAAIMKNKGRIIALDNDSRKLEELEKRARRGGASIIETRFIETRKVIKRLKDSADCVLLDVPCSGTGVIRRNPDTKWKLTEENFANLKVIQAEILDSYSSMVKPGGTLVYSTCSLFPSENTAQVQAFIAGHKDFIIEEEISLTPAKNNTDGFFYARMKRAI
ncbi:MAG: RsmB/NOP family class I SAM-dependent RNA methyltransferase [Ignavibacteriales bacterium]|nr:RsmB/NOP family class I SAM-dependent RNA methyltransferase [Ignavibacteriales bacterium]